MADNKNNGMKKEEKGRMGGQGTAKNKDKEFNQGNKEMGEKSRSSQRNND
jgi:hypothetical protein